MKTTPQQREVSELLSEFLAFLQMRFGPKNETIIIFGASDCPPDRTGIYTAVTRERAIAMVEAGLARLRAQEPRYSIVEVNAAGEVVHKGEPS